MSKYDIKNVEGQAAGQADLSDDVFGIEPNIPVIHQVVVCQDACLRQGTHSTKNRHEVSGGGRKPWRQKGTGRARQGSIRAAQWTGGGVVFGPTPRDHSKRINKKMVKLAMRSVLSGKVADSELVLVDSLTFEKPSTKQAKAVLDALGVSGKRVTVVIPDDDVVCGLHYASTSSSCFAMSVVMTRAPLSMRLRALASETAMQLTFSRLRKER